MLQVPVIDAHLHLWDPKFLKYPWLTGIPSLNRPFLLKDMEEAFGSVPVEKMVFVQCECEFSQYQQEADWISQLAQDEPRIAGIVAWAPLESGENARKEVANLSTNRLIKGIRRIIQFEEDMSFCLRPEFISGVKLLADYDLSFDICIAHHHLANTIKLVGKCPEVHFILDHIGKPDIKNHLLEPWKSELKTLSKFPNVFCKMSGLATEADHLHWTREDLIPYIDHVIDCFGFNRVVFGGDWPVATQAITYPEWVQTLDEVLTGCSNEDLTKFFYQNANDFYRLAE